MQIFALQNKSNTNVRQNYAKKCAYESSLLSITAEFETLISTRVSIFGRIKARGSLTRRHPLSRPPFEVRRLLNP